VKLNLGQVFCQKFNRDLFLVCLSKL